MQDHITILEDTRTLDLHEFCDILKYELNITNSKNTIIDTVKYLEKRGFVIYKDVNV